MEIIRTHDGQALMVDSHHVRALNEYTWRVYTHDDWRTGEAATDCFRGGVRTTMMLSRFLMERVLGRELKADETVRRKKQKLGQAWDYRDKNLEVAQLEASR